MGEHLTTADIAKEAGVTPDSVHKWINHGRLIAGVRVRLDPGRQFTRSYRIPRRNWEAFIEAINARRRAAC